MCVSLYVYDYACVYLCLCINRHVSANAYVYIFPRICYMYRSECILTLLDIYCKNVHMDINMVCINICIYISFCIFCQVPTHSSVA